MKRLGSIRCAHLWLSALIMLAVAFVAPACHTQKTLPPTPTALSSPSPVPTVAPTPTVGAPPALDCGDQAAALIPARAGDLARLEGAACYVMDVTIQPEQNWLTGDLRVQYTNREGAPLEQLVFRLYPNLPDRLGRLTIQKLTRDGQPVEPVLQQQETALIVGLRPALPAGAHTVIGIRFEVDIPTSARAGYQEFVYREGIMALAGFYPLIPARKNGAWDLEIPVSYGDVVVADAALYRVSVTLPRAMLVAGVGTAIEQRDNLAAQTKTLTFVSGPAREFNLALSAGYQVLSQSVGDTLVRAYFRPEQRAGGERALRVASDALRVFNALFGLYPYTELDVAATTTTAGGIEYPGLIVLNQFYYRGERDERFDWANVHEVAHQWWYGVVGNDQLQEPWLDEALTNYATLLYYERTTTPETARRLREEAFEAPAAHARQRGADQPIGLPVKAYAPADYGAIVYGKGPLFFQALREQVGDDVFFRILRVYYERFAYRMASGEQFLALAEEIAGQNLRPLYDEWVVGR